MRVPSQRAAMALTKSPLLSNETHSFQKHGVWGSISTWTDATGRVWSYVPTYGPATGEQAGSFPLRYGDDPNGSVQAFTVEADAGGRPYLQPRWRSIDLKMPDPVAVANGVVFALATGEDATQSTVDLIQDTRFGPGGNVLDEKQRLRLHEGAHATLHALDALTGRELWSSGEAISDWTHFSMPVVAAGRVFVTTNHGQVYAFGLGQDRGEHVYAPPAAATSAPAVTPENAAPAAASPSTSAPPASPAAPALWARHCAGCHGPHGEGRASAHTPDMRTPAWQQSHPQAAIEHVVREGRQGGMPPFETVLSPDEVASLVGYLRSLR